MNYLNLQKEVSKNDRTQYNSDIDKLRKQMECYEIKIEEYQKLADSICLNGDEMKQKLEEMNRQVIAERIQNLQLVRKLEIIEQNRNNQEMEYRKLERDYQEQRLLHDLASIEIARLQTLLLNSVPKKDYDKLLMQHKQILASDDSFKSTNYYKSTEKDEEYIGINLLEMTDEIKSAEVMAENAHLKEMINVLRSQNEYWQVEIEKIQEQNIEMMHFLEDVESESQMKSLLAALERRFLKALSDQAQFLQNQKLTDHQLLDQRNEFIRKKRNWTNEKKKLIQMIRSLQLLLQHMRSNSMELLTIQEMRQYKEKILEINANYAKSQKYKEEIEREKEELNLQLRHAEALRKSYELLQENDYSMIKLQKILQASQLNVLNVTKQLENAEIQIQRKDEQIQKLEEAVESLQKENEDLFAATFKITDFDDEDGKIDESIDPIAAEFRPNVEKEELLQSAKIQLKPHIPDISDEKVNLKIEESEILGKSESEILGKAETPTETIDSESDAKYNAAITDATQKIANIDSKEYMKKLNYIRETAKLCIANYKEQLKYKDKVIEKYKSLLRIMSSENDTQEIIIDSSSRIAEDLAGRKLRTSSEILSQNRDNDIEAKDREIVKLRNEIEHFIKANRKLTNDLQHFHRQTKDIAEANTQTDLLQKDDKMMMKERILGREIPSYQDSNLSSMIEESGKSITSQEPLTITRTLPPTESAQIVPTEAITENTDVLMEALRREESRTMIMRMEIKDLKQRNAALYIKNQELEKACENIRAEALSEIKHSYTSNIDVESEAIVMRLQKELCDLKIEAGNQKKLIREQKEIIDRFEKNQSVKKTQEEVSKWHEKKVRESNVDLLRKKLKETEQREQETCERLKKRDQQIKQLYKSESSRSAELKRLQEMIKKLRSDKEMSNLQMKLANDRLKTAEETNIYLNQKIIQLKKESKELLLSEKEKISKSVKIMDDIDEMSRYKISDEKLRELREKAEQ
ncbi:unnamed protein product, partial [Onchocerca ochengi]|uniref:CEP209_CC5 domain-containing protein n=1 Tax=Onchocerca ochengi TaxID=42157 RepID=A0A182EK82_ONCOC